MKKILTLLGAFLWLLGCSQPETYDLVIRNVRVFDGVEDLGIRHLAVNADTIAAISAEPLHGDTLIDGTGKFVLPGLVNAHVHISTEAQLKEGYAHGILANLNMHTGLEERERGWKELTRKRKGYPLLFGAGHAATVPGGHPTQFSPDMETIHDSITPETWVDHRIAAGADYIKIIRESEAWMGYPAQPTLDYGQIERLIRYAHQKGLLAVVHTSNMEETARIAALGADGFVHMPIFKKDYPLPEEHLKTIRESGAFIVPTAILVPAGYEGMEGAPEPVRAWALENLVSEAENVDFIRSIHQAGIPIVAGTDAPNNDLNLGDDFFGELHLYRQAGMSNLEVLRSATGNAARAFDLPVGILEEGRKAHFVLLEANPLEDLEHLRMVAGVWKDGSQEGP